MIFKNKKFIIIALIILLLIIAVIVFLTTRSNSTEKELIKVLNNLYIEDDEHYTVTKLKEAKRIDMKKSFDDYNLKEIYLENGINEKSTDCYYEYFDFDFGSYYCFCRYSN